MTSRFVRLFYTLTPLKAEQLWGLFYYRFLRRYVPFKLPVQKAQRVVWQDVDFPRYQPASWLGGHQFRFLNVTATVDSATWQASGESLLWHYNLQYLDCLHAVKDVAKAGAYDQLVQDWWYQHKPLQGVAWDPYPASLRAVNLCKWGWRNKSGEQTRDSKLWVPLLDRHYQEIKRKLEFHIQANHLFANLKALWFLQAALPECLAQDGSWLLKQVSKQLSVQFDEDGGHFELSPMYHRIMLWDVLDMLHIGRNVQEFQPVVQELEHLVPKALQWSVALSHPNEEEAFFNDSAVGVAPTLEALLSYAEMLGFTLGSVRNGLYSGYGVCQQGSAKLICDAAEVGATIQPGHVHADSLSMELSIGMQRVLVNSGTSEYGLSAERLRQRSTAAHNTVELDGRNSSDVWSGFRLGNKAHIVHRQLEFADGRWTLTAAHDGYGSAVHKRAWQFREGALDIVDSFRGKGTKISRFHLHPAIRVKQLSSAVWLLEWRGGTARFAVLSDGVDVQVEPGTWHSKFGEVAPNTSLSLVWNGEECAVALSWDDVS